MPTLTLTYTATIAGNEFVAEPITFTDLPQVWAIEDMLNELGWPYSLKCDHACGSMFSPDRSRRVCDSCGDEYVNLIKTYAPFSWAHQDRAVSGLTNRIELSGNYVRHEPDHSTIMPMTPEWAFELNNYQPLVWL